MPTYPGGITNVSLATRVVSTRRLEEAAEEGRRIQFKVRGKYAKQE